MAHADPIHFSPDLCASDEAMNRLLANGDREALPDTSYTPNSGRSLSAPRAMPKRLVFTHQTLRCLVDRVQGNKLPKGDPISIDLRDCQ